MTIILATASRHVGYLSADMLIYSDKQFGELKFPELDGTEETAYRAVWSGDGTPPRVVPLAYVPKVHPVPRLGLAVGTSGAVAVGQAWVNALAEIPVRGIDDLDIIAPGVLRQLVAQFPNEHPEVGTFHIGWSARKDCVVGRIYRSCNGFAPEAFANGTFSNPPLHRDSEGYERACELVDLAAHGIGIENLHTAAAGNVEAAYRAGMALRWLHFGGELLTVKVDRNGVSAARSIYRFADADKTGAATLPVNVYHDRLREHLGWQPQRQVGGALQNIVPGIKSALLAGIST